MQVVLRLLDANGALVRIDTALTVGALGTTPSLEAPNAQFLVPAAVSRNGLKRFLPIVLASHRNVTGAVTTATIPQ